MIGKTMVRGRFFVALAATAFLLGGASRASADTVVYGNGPINGTIAGLHIDGNWSVSDSFSSTGSFNLTAAQVGLWVDSGAAPSTLDWAIGTNPFLSDVSSGTATLSNTYNSAIDGTYSTYYSTLPLSGEIAAGTYYLTLEGATASNSGPVYWDDNNGASVAYYSTSGPSGSTLLDNYPGLPSGMNSESFQISDQAVVPEPTSLGLLARRSWDLGLLICGGAVRGVEALPVSGIQHGSIYEGSLIVSVAVEPHCREPEGRALCSPVSPSPAATSCD